MASQSEVSGVKCGSFAAQTSGSEQQEPQPKSGLAVAQTDEGGLDELYKVSLKQGDKNMITSEYLQRNQFPSAQRISDAGQDGARGSVPTPQMEKLAAEDDVAKRSPIRVVEYEDEEEQSYEDFDPRMALEATQKLLESSRKLYLLEHDAHFQSSSHGYHPQGPARQKHAVRGQGRQKQPNATKQSPTTSSEQGNRMEAARQYTTREDAYTERPRRGEKKTKSPKGDQKGSEL